MEIVPSSASPGIEIPDHELISKVGAGSYGDVWLARSALGSYRAVKVIFRNRFSGPKPFERELNGIRSYEPLSRSQPNVISILHVGSRLDLGCFYYVMELADDLKRGAEIDPPSYVPRTFSKSYDERISIDECIDVGIAVASGLEHLHQNGLAHRDIKPSNIVFIKGKPKLADIGLVTGIGSQASYVGTEGYIPPEGAGTPQADIFSLGKVLYEAASGKDRLNFPAMPTALFEHPERERLLELNEVLLRACDPSPLRRYKTVVSLLRDLELLKSGGSVKKARIAEKRWALAKTAAAASAVILMIVVAAISWREKSMEELRLEHTLQEISKARLKITEQPVGGTAFAGNTIQMQVAASGAELKYQWHRDGIPLPDETNSVLEIAQFNNDHAGTYFVEIRNPSGKVKSDAANWMVGAPISGRILNVQYGPHLNSKFEKKKGPAAIGISNNDTWNLISRDEENSKQWIQNGILRNMKWSDGSDSGASLTVTNAAGAWYTLCNEPLLKTYLYPVNREGSIYSKISNLAAGTYDIYVYAHGQPSEENAEIELRVRGKSLGNKSTGSDRRWGAPVWMEGVQYVKFPKVETPAESEIEIIINKGKGDIAVLNGIQIAEVSKDKPD